MKYFTPSMWRALQGDGKDDDVHESWQRAFQEYRQKLGTLRGRLGDEAFYFFDAADVHDGELLEFRVVDGSRPAPLSAKMRPWEAPMNFPVRAELAVLDAADKIVWRLSYSTIRSVSVDFPGPQTLFYQPGEGFGNWGYHELTEVASGFATKFCLRVARLWSSSLRM